MPSQVKMQVYLDQARYNSFKNMAKRLKLSMAQLMRRWIDEKIDSRKANSFATDPFWKCVGKGEGKTNDIAQRFDDYLYGEGQ